MWTNSGRKSFVEREKNEAVIEEVDVKELLVDIQEKISLLKKWTEHNQPQKVNNVTIIEQLNVIRKPGILSLTGVDSICEIPADM